MRDQCAHLAYWKMLIHGHHLPGMLFGLHMYYSYICWGGRGGSMNGLFSFERT